MSQIDNALNQNGDDKLFSELEKMRKENARLQAKVAKKEKWIEKDEKLANKPRTGRLVTINDLEDPAFVKKYPKARIGDEFNDPEPLLWKVGLKKRPTVEEQHARMAAQFARDFREEMSDDQTSELLEDFEDFDEPITEGEMQAFLNDSARIDAQNAKQLPPAEQSDNVANGGAATAKPSATADNESNDS